ncbi:hypothetical protein HPP92_021735 [Vanilla planifolia]|uniref:Uncharacterized protein n=1 Tax=Vanilla planifolia TaxID=51239 RepID=A0A835U7D9_VANPL|nr:hypothetical protein HPP92_027620 [Vanilla planifolia]KAG0458607.1 hypothetical protein HPP92_021735 [Vanilla planifolia]
MVEGTHSPPRGQEAKLSKPRNPEERGSAAASADRDDKNIKLDHAAFHNSKYFKIRSIVKDLRPFFVEVSQTPDFRKSGAAQEIQRGMKNMIELIKELRSESASVTNHKETSVEHTSSETIKEEHGDKQEEREKQAQNSQSGMKNEVPKQMISPGEQELQDPFLVGGSPVGWNFLIYSCGKPVYYGVSKETARARHAAKTK